MSHSPHRPAPNPASTRRLPWRTFDWNLRSCGWHGHITYRPTETELAERLRADTVVGEAWRCLRCRNFVVGDPDATGPADHAPTVLHGKALREATILRVLAAERFVRGVLLVLIAYGIYRFDDSRRVLRDIFDTYLPLLRPVAQRANVDLESTGPVHLIERVLSTNHQTLLVLTLAILAYGILQLTEGVGLWLMKRWGEYVAVVGTGLFIPLEVYEVVENLTVLKLAALAVNVGAVVYLVWSKRLFGIRGGHAAFEAERHGQSLLEVERAAAAPKPVPAPEPVPEPRTDQQASNA